LGAPFLSIVIPAHNEENRLPGSLESMAQFFATQPYKTEVLVVENGSHDRTLEVVQAYTAHMPYLRVLHEDARGKGLAVKRGMLAAQGEYRFICDADLSMPIAEVNRFIPPALPGAVVAIGSREAPGAVRYNEPAYRHLIGRAFNTMVRWTALPGLQDTQCGFKCFRGDVAQEIFSRQTLDGMSFDVEVLFIARMRGYPIAEVPIPWYFNADSRVRIFKDSMRMGLDILHIRRNGARGIYA
jgi:dolichyl-phosphate beta-glucosyltransferase